MLRSGLSSRYYFFFGTECPSWDYTIQVWYSLSPFNFVYMLAKSVTTLDLFADFRRFIKGTPGNHGQGPVSIKSS